MPQRKPEEATLYKQLQRSTWPITGPAWLLGNETGGHLVHNMDFKIFVYPGCKYSFPDLDDHDGFIWIVGL